MYQNMNLPKGWYAIVHLNELSKTPKRFKRLNKQLCIWKFEDEVVVMDDRCPHRGASLSVGKVINNCISCPFHGFKFNNIGECISTPETKGSIPKLKVKVYQTKIVADMIWINFLDCDRYSDGIGFATRVHNEFNGKYATITDIWDSNIRHCIENDLDYTHLKTVHGGSIGKGFEIPDDMKISLSDENIILEDTKLKLEYAFPNVSSVKFSKNTNLVIYFVPIDESQTKLYVFHYRSFLTSKIVFTLSNIVFNLANRLILKEDKRVVTTQKYDASYEKDFLLYHDKMIKEFRKMWKNK